jgi:hypothetical protein
MFTPDPDFYIKSALIGSGGTVFEKEKCEILYLLAVFRIRYVLLRIRSLGSVALSNGSGSCSFRQQKILFVFLLITVLF